MNMETQFTKIETELIRMVLRIPAYGVFSLHLDKKPDKAILTMGIGYSKKSRSIHLIYNPEFTDSLTAPQLESVLEHELLHYALGHITTRVGDMVGKESSDKALLNIAMDVSINQFLSNLPSGCCSIQTIQVPLNKNKINIIVEEKREFEYYYKLLKMLPPEVQNSMGGNGLGDNAGVHNWDEVPEEIRQQIEAELKAIIAKAKNTNTWGTLPGGLEILIERLLDSRVPWQQHLKYFAQTCQSTNKIYTYNRQNRRYPKDRRMPGLRKDNECNILVCLDTSGSVYSIEELINQFVAEIFELSKRCNIFVLQHDYNVQWVGNIQSFNKIAGGGGTSFDECFKFAADKDFRLETCRNHGFGKKLEKFSGIILLTDGEAAPPNLNEYNGKILWCLGDRNQTPPIDVGSTTNIE